MKKFLQKLSAAINNSSLPQKIAIVAAGILYFAVLLFSLLFDKNLAIGVLFISFLTIALFSIIWSTGIKIKTLLVLFLLVLCLHIATSVIFNYTKFQPFGGGYSDASTYDAEGMMVSNGLKSGKIHLREIIFNNPSFPIANYFSAFVGIIYFLTAPAAIIGKLVNAWLVALSSIFLFLTVLELKASKKSAFLVGLISGIYPSYILYSSMLLKDTLFACLMTAGLLLSIKLIKNFSWSNFSFLYIILVVATSIRFYIAYALLFSFIICWFLFAELKINKKIIYGIILIILLGFVPDLGLNQGFYGADTFKFYMNKNMITFFREDAYSYAFNAKAIVPVPSSAPTPAPTPEVVAQGNISSENFVNPNRPADSGFTSSIEVKTELDKPLNFLLNYLETFIFAVFGPFPWQIRYARQALALFETIPWYFLCYFIIKGLIRSLKQRNKFIAPLFLFGLMAFGVIGLYVTNFGIITRIRIPAFLAFSCIAALGFSGNIFGRMLKSNKLAAAIADSNGFAKIRNIWEKIF